MKPFPQHRAELGQLRIGLQVFAFHIGVRDADPPIAAKHLIARPHDMLAGTHLDLLRPARTRQQFPDAQTACRKRADSLFQRNNRIVSHQIQADIARWYRNRV